MQNDVFGVMISKFGRSAGFFVTLMIICLTFRICVAAIRLVFLRCAALLLRIFVYAYTGVPRKGKAMVEIQCEMCGSNNLIKHDGEYVCQHCETRYSTEEAKNLWLKYRELLMFREAL